MAKKEFSVYAPDGVYIRTYTDKKVADGFASKVEGRKVKAGGAPKAGDDEENGDYEE